MEFKFGQFYRTKDSKLLEFMYAEVGEVIKNKWYVFRNCDNYKFGGRDVGVGISEFEVKDLKRDEISDILYGE